MNYTIFAKSAIGASHKPPARVNQDDYKLVTFGDISIISVADGHGSKRSPYSQFGAQLAVNIFCDSVKKLYAETGGTKKLFENLCNIRHEHLPKKIVDRWQREVKIHFQNKKYQRNEVLLNEESPPKDDENIYEKYGTTLIGLVITNTYYFALQLGDGDIISVNNSGVVERVITPEKILGVETFSLSSTNAWVNFISQPVHPAKQEDMPVLFMVSTDGLSNSFVDDQAFLQVGKDYLEWIKRDSINHIQEKMYNILRRTSKLGSGDDITLAIAANIDRIEGEGGDA